jgi:hypothetical protein
VLRPLTPEDALAYWASEQQQAVRLAAYYEVRLLQLEPEPAAAFANPVLSVGQWVAPMREISLSASRSGMRFARPAVIGSTLPAVIELSPARASLTRPAIDTPTFPDTHHFWLVGSGLAGGIRRRVVVAHDGWRGLGVPGGEIVLQEAVQPAGPTSVWDVAFQDHRVDIRIANRIAYRNAAGAPATLPIVPGTYRARVEIVAGERVVGLTTREIVRQSNEVLFQIAPRILSADPPAVVPGAPPRRRVTLRIAPRFDLNQVGLDVGLVVDGEVYDRISAWAASAAEDDGNFRTTTQTLTFQPNFDVTEKGLHAVRLRVNGVDAQPFWLETGP